jgi:Uma2 family endonuclease
MGACRKQFRLTANAHNAPFDVYLSNVDVFQPDILFVVNENRQVLTDAGAEGAPDLVVEVLSPKTRNLDLAQKRRVYAREGVRELWVIDPEPQTVLVYRFEEDLSDPVMTKTAKETLTSPIFPELEIVLEKVFKR